MVTFPHAKINLGLQVIEKRHDGYHNLISCFYPIGWCDVLEAIPSSDFSFDTSGHEIPGSLSENLCVKAFELLQQQYQISPVKAHLHKVIPVGAGLGGGSSDGASMLKLLNELFALDIPKSQLQEYAAQLGSDCPFFLNNTPQLVQGRGEKLSPIELQLPAAYLLVVYPNIMVSTAQAFRQLTPQAPAFDLAELLQSKPPNQWHQLGNDFEQSVFSQYPAIASLKDLLYQMGADFASMSGSGASVYGFFSEEPEVTRIPPQYSIWLQET